MKKRILLMLVLLIQIVFVWAKEIKIDGVTYAIKKDGYAYIHSVDKNLSEVILHGAITYKGIEYKVKDLDNRRNSSYPGPALLPQNAPNLRKVILDSKFTEIPYHFFYEIEQIEEVIIPNSISKIGYSAFEGCESLKKIILPSSVKILECDCFKDCSSLEFAYLPGVVELNGGSFENCASLHSVFMPNVRSISTSGLSPFEHCSLITNLIVADDFYSQIRLSNLTNVKTKSGKAASSYKDWEYLFYEYSPYRKNNCVNADPDFESKILAQYGVNEGSDTFSNNITKSIVVDKNIDESIPAGQTDNKSTFAFIIGNERYTRVAHVPYAQNDAKIFAEYSKKTLGMPAKNVRIYENATFGAMLTAVNDIRQIVEAYQGNVNIIFYYAGHGVPNETSKDAYLLPVDADGRQIEACYSVSRLYKELGELGAKNVVVFMDACFSGAQRGEGMLASARGVALKAKTAAAKGNMVVFSAATGDETAYPYNEKGHGMFTYFLLKKLQETKGDCTLGELGEFIQTNVRQQSVVINHKSQTPTIVPSDEMKDRWRGLKLR